MSEKQPRRTGSKGQGEGTELVRKGFRDKVMVCFLNPHPMIRGFCFCFHFLFLETGRERERNTDWQPPVHSLTGTELATEACALTGDPAHNPPVTGQHSNQLSHPSRGQGDGIFKHTGSGAHDSSLLKHSSSPADADAGLAGAMF